MKLLNSNSKLIQWDFDPSDVKAWEKARFDIQHGGEMLRFGGSELSQVLNVNKYDGALHLFQVKLGKVAPKKPNLLMLHGNQVENVILDYVQSYDLNNPDEETTASNFLSKNFIRTITKAEFFIVSDDYPCLSISLDGVLKEGEPSLHDPNILMPFDTFVEVKNVSWSSFNSWNGEIPIYYYAQLMGGLAVTGAPYCYFVAFVDNRELWIRKVDANPEWFEHLNTETIDLSLKITKAKLIQDQLDTNCLHDTQRQLLLQQLWDLEPVADGLESTTKTLKELYPVEELEIIDEERESYLARYVEINSEMSALKEEKDTIKNQTLQVMKTANVLICGGYKAKRGKDFRVSKVKVK